jgi:hypothetical protein
MSLVMTFPIPLLRAVTLAIALLVGSAAAHEGHDDGGQAGAFPKGEMSARLASTSGPFELVALLQKGELVIYLDRFESDDPVVGATVTVETPAGSVAANAKAGAYRLSATWATAGSHDLIFTVTADDVTEILIGVLKVAPDLPGAARSGGWSLFSPAIATASRTAITIFGGLFSATLLDAFLTPILFLQFGERPLVRALLKARARPSRTARSVQPTPIETNGDEP